MRIVVSGSHGTGKTTLVADLASRLPGYVSIEEPYHTMVAEGHAFAVPPGIEDFESLIERSNSLLTEQDGPNMLFDRGPIDYLAYLAVVARDASSVMSERLPRVRDAIRRIDLVVFVPIEDPDRIATSSIDARRLRQRAHSMLHELLIEDAWALKVPVLQVTGSPASRVDQVLSRLDREC